MVFYKTENLEQIYLLEFCNVSWPQCISYQIITTVLKIKISDYKEDGHLKMYVIKKTHGKKSTEIRITQKIGKEWGNSYWKMKRSPDERHTQTQVSLIETFQRLQMSFSIRRE